jgi:sacsin
MPLRSAPSPLRKDVKSFGVDMALKHLIAYSKEARISLLFLRKIKAVTFRCQMSDETLWSVVKETSLDGPDPLPVNSGFITCLYQHNINDEVAKTKDQWWVYKEVDQSLEPVPIHLRERLSRVRKNVECGIAALISCLRSSGTKDLPRPIPKIFSSLPLPIPSNLPVHIHATFQLSGDRRSLSTGGELAETSGSDWNKWLLEDKVTRAYFNSLEGLARRMGAEVYRFWPHGYFGKGELAPLIESFWNTLPSIDFPMYPGVESPEDVSKVMTKSEAIFNLFPPIKSEVLDPFLKDLVPNLVTSIPATLVPRFKGMPFKCVCRKMLRDLLKTAEAKEWLRKAPQAGVSRAILNEILSELISINAEKDELDDLVGCALIPLENSSLGELQLLQAGNRTRCYYIVDEFEFNIFSFAQCLIVPQTFRYTEGLQELVKQGRFNIKALQLCHVRDLLSLRQSSSKIDDPATDEWLSKFWSYWNRPNLSVEVPIIEADLFAGQPLLKSRYMGTSVYRSFDELDTLPCVIDPTDETHRVLCQGVTGLHIFRPDFMPHSISKAEASLSDSRSFERFINALSKLYSAGPPNKVDFVRQRFTESALHVSSESDNKHNFIETTC